MKKTYEKPLSEAVRLGLRGEDIAGIGVSGSSAVPRDENDKINGGDALVKDGGAWDTDGLWN